MFFHNYKGTYPCLEVKLFLRVDYMEQQKDQVKIKQESTTISYFQTDM